MKVFLLAAGRGERLKPLTDECPKPLLQVGPCSLVEHHIRRLKKRGFNDFIINIAYRKEAFKEQLGDGHQLGVNLTFSEEEPGELETGGGIIKALPLLGDEPFLLISSDIWTDFDFATLRDLKPEFGHCFLVENPDFHPQGDFYYHPPYLSLEGIPEERLTYANIGVFNPAIFKAYTPGNRRLASIWFDVMKKHPKSFTAERFHGKWRNITTADDLHALQKDYREQEA